MKRKVIAVLLPAHPIPRQMLPQKTEQKNLMMRKQMTQKAKWLTATNR